jgi:hypothetical protein
MRVCVCVCVHRRASLVKDDLKQAAKNVEADVRGKPSN